MQQVHSTFFLSGMWDLLYMEKFNITLQAN